MSNRHYSRKRAIVSSGGTLSGVFPRKSALARAIAVALMTGCVAVPASAWAAETTQEQAVAKSPQTETQAGNSAAYQIYRDPVTGKFGPPPATTTEGVPPTSLDLSSIQQNLSTSSDELEEKSVPIGGRNAVMMKLNGQFQDTLTVTIDADGKISMPPSSTPSQEKE